MENQRDAHVRRHEEAKALASRLMHMHYCDGDAGGVASFFAPQFTWLGAGVYVVTGRMWITTAPGVKMYLKVHQRVTFVFQETPDGLRCAHIHCSNPYQEMVEEELFPEKIGRQSYDFVQERLAAL